MLKWQISTFLLTALCGFLVFGWIDSCNKPCPESVVYKPLKFDFKMPPPSHVTDGDTAKATAEAPKPGFIRRLRGKKDYYKVREGENMYRIGLKYGVPAVVIQQLAGKYNFDLMAGEEIYIGTQRERDSLLRLLNVEQVFTYDTTVSKNGVNVGLTTQTAGKMLSQSIDITFDPVVEKKPKNHILGTLGTELRIQNNQVILKSINPGVIFQHRSGWGVGAMYLTRYGSLMPMASFPIR